MLYCVNRSDLALFSLDFVLVYQEYEDKPEEWREKRRQKRHKFIERLVKEGLKWEEDKVQFFLFNCDSA